MVIEGMPDLSVVVPCFNEEDALPVFFKEIIPHLNSLVNGSWEIIVVDDGSSDSTWSIISAYSEKDKRIHGVALSRNFGHQPAVDTGLVFASGKYVAVLDCDLQDPPEVLVELMKKAQAEHYDVCYAVRKARDAPLPLRFLYKLFYRLMMAFAERPWPLDAGDFCVVNRSALNSILAMPESIRMLRGLRSWIGLKQGYISYDRPARVRGRSKYNLFTLSSLATRAFVGYSQAPLRLASWIGLCMALLSGAAGSFFVLNRLVPGITPFGYYIGQNPGITTLAVLILFISSMLFVCIGIMGEYLAVIIKEIKGRPTAIVRETAGNPRMQSHNIPIIVLPDTGESRE
jgi:glycosyltransferase involved in cell wall biosynthesis